jgi:Na+-transporting NADH:ubiquinone oxidoreductase subunit A
MRIKIKKGLDIPLAGQPEQIIDSGKNVSSVALLGPDTIDLKPQLLVKEGEHVRLGQALFNDKQNPGVQFTSPGCGTVSAINRGERRVLQSVVIQLDGDDEETFKSYERDELPGLDGQLVRQNLLASGLWTAFRTRPFSKIPAVDATPRAIFVTAIDTNPLSADPAVVVRHEAQAFADGLQLISTLTNGYVYLCTAPDSAISAPDGEKLRHAEFSGPHPAGLVGTHIHLLEPVGEKKSVWHLGYQDVIAIGKLFVTGRLAVDRVVALGGPLVRSPRLIKTRMGASSGELLHDELNASGVRAISGSVLAGHRAAGWAAYLGRYHSQLTVLQEGSPREFLAWMRPGLNKFSVHRAYAAHLLRRKRFAMSTTQNGSPRAMVSIGSFERVMPLDILPTPLLKALLVDDTDAAKELGCLELDEEDLALCSFVCNGKYEYGPYLRRNLHEIEVNG